MNKFRKIQKRRKKNSGEMSSSEVAPLQIPTKQS